MNCRECGACCKNLPSNGAFAWWVEVEEDAAILGRADLVKKHVVRDAEGVPHLRIADDGRCLALRGALGRDVECGIYHWRPAPCRRVQPGDELCLRYRAEHGIT